MNKIVLFVMMFVSCSSTKFCVNCKHYIPKKLSLFYSEFGKCSVFPQPQVKDEYFLVTGKNSNTKKEYNYCSIARNYEDMCGVKAKYYEKK